MRVGVRDDRSGNVLVIVLAALCVGLLIWAIMASVSAGKARDQAVASAQSASAAKSAADQAQSAAAARTADAERLRQQAGQWARYYQAKLQELQRPPTNTPPPVKPPEKPAPTSTTGKSKSSRTGH